MSEIRITLELYDLTTREVLFTKWYEPKNAEDVRNALLEIAHIESVDSRMYVEQKLAGMKLAIKSMEARVKYLNPATRRRPMFEQIKEKHRGVVVVCDCTQHLHTEEMLYDHWQRGHFDEYDPYHLPEKTT